MLLEYQIEVECAKCNGNGLVIDWTDEPRDVTKYKVELDAATMISLVPRENTALPIVRVQYDAYKRWVVFHKKIAGFQFYAIGWQTTVRGLNIKAINWIHPDGSIEMTLEPYFQ